jgi:hypothetical protein
LFGASFEGLKRTVLGQEDTLNGGAVWPGFELSIKHWFTRAGRRQSR